MNMKTTKPATQMGCTRDTHRTHTSQRYKDAHTKQQRVHLALAGPILSMAEARVIIERGKADSELLRQMKAKV